MPEDKRLLSLYRAQLVPYLKVVAVALTLVVIVAMIMPHTYTGLTSVMPPTAKSSGGGLASLLQSSPVDLGLDGASSNKSSLVFKDILTSRTLYEGVIDTAELLSNELFAGMETFELIEDLERKITISTKKTGTLVIEADVKTGWFPFDDSPALAAATSAKIANACRIVLDVMNQEKSVSQARLTRAYIERVLSETKRQIDSIQEVMLKFQIENKVFALEEQMGAIVENAVMIGSELAKAELELTLIQQDYSATSPQVELYEKKVSSLQEQYERVQTGGLVTTDGFSIPFEKVPDLTRQYTNLVRDQKIKEKLNAYLESQRMQELIQEAKDTPTVIVLDTAVVPHRRSAPARSLMVIVTWFVVTLGFIAYVPLRQIYLSK